MKRLLIDKGSYVQFMFVPEKKGVCENVCMHSFNQLIKTMGAFYVKPLYTTVSNLKIEYESVYKWQK